MRKELILASALTLSGCGGETVYNFLDCQKGPFELQKPYSLKDNEKTIFKNKIDEDYTFALTIIPDGTGDAKFSPSHLARGNYTESSFILRADYIVMEFATRKNKKGYTDVEIFAKCTEKLLPADEPSLPTNTFDQIQTS